MGDGKRAAQAIDEWLRRKQAGRAMTGKEEDPPAGRAKSVT
jgi:hypothetical protein